MIEPGHRSTGHLYEGPSWIPLKERTAARLKASQILGALVTENLDAAELDRVFDAAKDFQLTLVEVRQIALMLRNASLTTPNSNVSET
jgi:hypothetical protein